MSRTPTGTGGTGIPALYATIGFSLCWVALEKIVYPRWALYLLEQHPQLGGVYNIGGASDGVGRALQEAGRSDNVVFIGHGLTPDTRAMLIDGTMDAAITQSPQTVIGNALKVFCNAAAGRDPMAGVEALRLNLVLRENLP